MDEGWGCFDDFRLYYLGSIKQGDANGDGFVTIADAIAVVNYILGNDQEKFFFDAANVNKDEDTIIADAVGIISIVLNQ